jgi:hypothetical protein
LRGSFFTSGAFGRADGTDAVKTTIDADWPAWNAFNAPSDKDRKSASGIG